MFSNFYIQKGNKLNIQGKEYALWVSSLFKTLMFEVWPESFCLFATSPASAPHFFPLSWFIYTWANGAGVGWIPPCGLTVYLCMVERKAHWSIWASILINLGLSCMGVGWRISKYIGPLIHIIRASHLKCEFKDVFLIVGFVSVAWALKGRVKREEEEESYW